MISKIKEWPQGERPRERLLKEGAEVLPDSQLLAVLLRTGSIHSNAVQLAIELLKKFHSLQEISNSSISELCSVKGMGPAKAAQLKAAIEFGRRSLTPLIPGVQLTKSQDVYRHFSPMLKNSRKEIFKIILLDQKNKLLREVTVSQGSLTATIVHPREVFNPAVRDSAASVIFLHNHPSGDPSPSLEDKALTRRLIAAGSLLGIQVLDHIVIGSDSYYSFADSGFIEKPTFKTSSHMNSVRPYSAHLS